MLSQIFLSQSPGERKCTLLASEAVVTEPTKKQLRPRIISGQMRWLCLQSKSLPRTKETCFNAILVLTAGISDCQATLKWQGPWQQGVMAGQPPQKAPVSTRYQALQLLVICSLRSWPSGSTSEVPANSGATPHAGGQTAGPRYLPAGGLQEVAEPLLCRASLSAF